MPIFAITLFGMLVSSSVHGYIGVQRAGHRIEHVIERSPAEKAGLKVGDKVLSVDGKKDASIDGPAYENVELEIKRHDEILHFEIQRVSHLEAYGE
jgi:predicted metalloprotease with PDZ domain